MNINESSRIELPDLNEQIISTCSDLLQNPFARGEHQCNNPEMDEFLDCATCQQSVIVYQTLAQLVEQLCPKNQMAISVVDDEVSGL